MMKVSATLSDARVSSRKAGLAAGLVRGKFAQAAVEQLRFSPRKASRLLAGLLHSAMANAENVHGLDPASLKVSEVKVGSAGMLKRFQPRAFGRAFPIRHRLCHMTVILVGEPTSKKKSSADKAKTLKATKSDVSTTEASSAKPKVAPVKAAKPKGPSDSAI